MSDPTPKDAKAHPNREAWLHKLTTWLRPWFREHGHPLPGEIKCIPAYIPQTKVGGLHLGRKKGNANSGKEPRVVLISVYDQLWNAETAAGILAHELLHAALPHGEGHGKLWNAACQDIHLTDGKGTHAKPGPALLAHLETLVANMPPFPNIGMPIPPKPERKPRGTPGKFRCPTCKLTIRMTATAIEIAGLEAEGLTPPCFTLECESNGEGMEELPYDEPPKPSKAKGKR